MAHEQAQKQNKHSEQMQLKNKQKKQANKHMMQT